MNRKAVYFFFAFFLAPPAKRGATLFVERMTELLETKNPNHLMGLSKAQVRKDLLIVILIILYLNSQFILRESSILSPKRVIFVFSIHLGDKDAF